MNRQSTQQIRAITLELLLSWLLLTARPAYANTHPASIRAAAAPLLQTSCTLPATVTTANQLRDCITAANNNGAALDTITLGADITLTSALPQITTAITLEGAGYAIDGGNSIQLFNVGTAGDLTVKEATLQNGRSASGGGAIYNDGALTLINSTLAGNTATTSGGAIFNATVSTVTVVNSTFSDNTASNSGGAIYTVSTLILTNNTIAANTATEGSGIYLTSGQSYLAGNIFAGNTTGDNCTRLFGTLNDNGYNLSDDGTCTNGGAGSAINATLALGDLADNGGPTQTHLPGTGSDAIGAIPNGSTISNNGIIWACQASTLFVDQRGESRPQYSSDDCTAGAVEVAANSTTLTIIKDATPAIGTDFDFTLTSGPFSNYSGSTSGNPFWTRPNEGATCTNSTVSTRYHVQAFAVSTSGFYDLGSDQSGWNGYIHVYQDSFNPQTPCANYLNGDSDALFSSTSEIIGQFLEAGRTYYFVTSGNSTSDAGNFTNSVNPVGNVYALGESFTLDDAVPDDGDGVNASVTFNVAPGTYAITESLPSGWSVTSATCTGASGSVSLTDETLSVAVSDGETVTCTFTNETLCPASWTVTTADELAGCIAQANNNESPSPTADTITLGANINLSAALPSITSEITLEGANHVIDGGNSVQLFYVDAGGDFTVNQATLQNGSANDASDINGDGINGGGINNNGKLTVTNSTISGNTAVASGGGIFNGAYGTLAVANSTISGNTATGDTATATPGYGGGIYSFNATVTVTNSAISNNTAAGGGGIYLNRGTATVTDSTISGNSATNGGGGISISSYGTVAVTNSTISGNTVTGTGDGGGINNSGTATVTDSTLHSNTANRRGGGINNSGTLTVTTSTFSGNSAATRGGGIYNDGGTVTVTTSTFYRNSATAIGVGGVYNNGGTVHLAGVILDNGTSGANCSASITDNGYNLSDDASCGFSGTSANMGSLNLSTLSVTTTPGQQVHTPQTGSDAIGAIPYRTTINNNGVTLACNQTATDQLGADRPITAFTACTAGAVEVTMPPICTSWTVTTADELYDCIIVANNNESPSPTADTITLGADIDLTTLTTSPLPRITSAITLEGAGYAVDGGNSVQLFYVNSGGDFTVNQATLQNGSATSGGGIRNYGTVTVINSTISGNTADTDGGGIDNYNGMLTVTNSTISGNSAGEFGGGIGNGGTLTVTNSTISGNTAGSGGGIDHVWGTTTVTNSTISGNTATGSGGGILNANGMVTVTNSTISGNTATNGGGIANLNSTVTVSNSTFSGNSATSTGGGIYNDTGTVTVTNSTFSGNTATGSGGGIYNDTGTVKVTNSTFSRNSAFINGGGIYNGTGTVHLAGTIFAVGPKGNNCANFGTLNDNGYNLSDDASCGFTGTGSAVNATLNLSALSATTTPGQQVHTPQTGSDAIGVIPNGTTINNNGVTLACNSTTTDQLGADRPITIGTACTSGAVEVAVYICPASWTVATAGELFACITLANNNESPSPTADTITLGANITLSTALPQITSEITLEGAGYAVDGGGSVQLFSVTSDGDFTVNQATLQNGSATFGGGIYNDGTLTLTDSAFSGNSADYSGGGIYNDEGTLTVSNSTFSGNSANAGGGILNDGRLTLTNSTFSGNSASVGGGIYNDGRLTLTNSTFSDNSASEGGGIYSWNNGTVHLAGTIFANSPSGDNCLNDGGTLNDNGYNLSEDASCGFTGTGSANSATLNLSALSSTTTPGQQVHTPQTGSDAIGLIPNGTSINNNGVTLACNGTTTDQLGADRPINSGTACAAGAVEVAMPPICPSWTVTTADELFNCITVANGNENPSPTADTITLGADITLSTALPQITSEITLEGAGYAIDGGDSVRIFTVGNSGNLTVNQATLQNGSADNGGGIYNSGTVTVTSSTLSGNHANADLGGGGIYNNGGAVTVVNSTFSDNYSIVYGGGIFSADGTVMVTNSTFSGNTAYNSGGGIQIEGGTLTVTNSTFSGNSGAAGAIHNYDADGTMHLAGNIFAASDSGSNCSNYGTLIDSGYNLSDDGTCTNGGTGSATNATLNLGPLADNGGPTLTHLPGAGSDAIGLIPSGTTISNNGASWTCDQSATDQRGVSRPINVGTACTAGAVEVAMSPLCPSWTATTADELSDCITLANNNESPSPTADTITLGADITLSTALPQITSEITVEGAGYAVDGRGSVQLFFVALDGDFTINQATLQNGVALNGGGIFNRGTLIVTNSTFSGNLADIYGGGIYNIGTLTVNNSTFSGNSAVFGGGIANFDANTIMMTNSTFFGNSASIADSIYNYESTLHLAANIFDAGTTGNNCFFDTFGIWYDNGYNLSDDATCGFSGTGSANNATLNLGALTDNGGPTQTHLPGAGSDAIGAIPNGTTISNNGTSWTCDQSANDQRGESRPINSGEDCTAGAVEVARVQLTLQPNGYFSWLPDRSGSCSESLYRSSTPYVGHTWLTDDPANYDGSGSLTSVAINYFYYLLVDCGGSLSQSNEVGEFTFAIVPGG